MLFISELGRQAPARNAGPFWLQSENAGPPAFQMLPTSLDPSSLRQRHTLSEHGLDSCFLLIMVVLLKLSQHAQVVYSEPRVRAQPLDLVT